MGGTELLGISRAGQTVLARLMESQIRHLPSGSVSLLGEGLEKGQWLLPAFLSGSKLSPCSHLDASHFSTSLYATGAFKLLPWCWSSESVNLSKVICVLFKENYLELQKFFHQLNPIVFFAARRHGDLSFWHWNAELGGLV